MSFFGCHQFNNGFDAHLVAGTLTLGLVDIFKSGREWSHMRDFIYIKCCAKGFFSEISILDDK